MANDANTSNLFLVGVQGKKVRVLRTFTMGDMNRDAALNLAAYVLVNAGMAADDPEAVEAQFNELVQAIKQT